jgi:Fe-S-cluster containining protein
MSVDHNSVVDDWRTNAAAHDDANFDFLHSLKSRDPRETDALAGRLHREAFQIVDCTRCANCCKTMSVRLNRDEIERIAGHLGMSPADFTAKYLTPAEEENEFEIVARPCPFLGTDDRCTIYEVRPDCCRAYPHTDAKDFATRTTSHSANTLVCPAVFWIVEQMRRRRSV